MTRSAAAPPSGRSASTAPPRAPDRRAGRVAGLLALLAVAVAGVWAVAEVFLWSRLGLRLDQAVLEASQLARSRTRTVVEVLLDAVSVLSLAVATGVVAVVALLRRRVALALAAVVLVLGANVTTQLVKELLVRPDLGIGPSVNSLPSGHTTVAASVAVALVLVVPVRLRPLAAVLGALYAGATGVATVAAAWHRPSDAVAALLVVLAWGAAVAAALSAAGRSAAADGSGGGGHTVTALMLGVGGLAGGAVAGVALAAAADRLPLEGRLGSLVAYSGGAALIGATALCVFAVWLVAVGRGLRAPHR